MDLALIDARQFGVVDNLAVEVEPLGVGASHLVPELDKPHQFAVLIVAGQVGIGVTQAAALLFEREERQHARPGFALEREVMAVESGGVAAEWDRVEVEREPIGLGKDHGGEGLDPPLQQTPLLVADGPIRVGGGERLLGENVESGEQAKNLISVEIVDMTTSLFVEQLQRQERQQSARGGDHPRTGVPGLGDEPIETEPGQEWQEEEDTRDPRADHAARFEAQLTTIRDIGRFGDRPPTARTSSEGPPAAVREKKGVATPRRQSARKQLAIDLSVAGVYPNRSATGSRGSSSTKIARSAS